jgi:hypothetical protein
VPDNEELTPEEIAADEALLRQMREAELVRRELDLD